MKDYTYYWAFRYADTNEPALVLIADSAFQNDQMLSIAFSSPVLVRDVSDMHAQGDGLRSVRLSEAELGTWRSFDLCPIVKVTFNDENKRFMYSTVQVTL